MIFQFIFVTIQFSSYCVFIWYTLIISRTFLFLYNNYALCFFYFCVIDFSILYYRRIVQISYM